MRTLALLVAALLLASCGRPPRPAAMAEAERIRAAPAVADAQKLAPEAFAHADKLRGEADRMYAAGDSVAAQILSERAVVAYEHATVLARLARADARRSGATVALGEAQNKLAELEAEDKKVTAETRDLEMRIKVETDAETIAPVGGGDAARERARLTSARSLALDARLLCAAAAMLDPKTPGLEAARKAADDVGQKVLADAKPAPIEPAMRARQGCLSALTAARRAKAGMSSTGKADELLAQLSATGGYAPWRDDRGVVLTLRDLFEKEALTGAASGRLSALGRVAQAHPAFPVQVVAHGPSPGGVAQAELAREKARAEAVAKALADAGAAPDRLEAQAAGGSHPVAMPGALKAASRNERIEIIFVDPGG